MYQRTSTGKDLQSFGVCSGVFKASLIFSGRHVLKQAIAVREILTELGFNTTYLRSTKYVLKKLASLNAQDLSMLKTVFSENKHPRFMKEFSFHDPYGRSRFYIDALKTADLEKLTKLISVCAMLLQTKAYLFWN